MKTVGILIFDDVEVLDFAGPFEVFSRTRTTPGLESRRSDTDAPFRVITIGVGSREVRATGGLGIVGNCTVEDAPELDILVVPGGFGTRPLLADDKLIAWLRARAVDTALLTSVCTGSLLLARAGLLKGRRATTHWGALDMFGEIDSTVDVQRESRVVDDGIITSAGVASGIDMAFYVVGKECGEEVARETAKYIEYPWSGLATSRPVEG